MAIAFLRFCFWYQLVKMHFLRLSYFLNWAGFLLRTSSSAPNPNRNHEINGRTRVGRMQRRAKSEKPAKYWENPIFGERSDSSVRCCKWIIRNYYTVWNGIKISATSAWPLLFYFEKDYLSARVSASFSTSLKFHRHLNSILTLDLPLSKFNPIFFLSPNLNVTQIAP